MTLTAKDKQDLQDHYHLQDQDLQLGSRVRRQQGEGTKAARTSPWAWSSLAQHSRARSRGLLVLQDQHESIRA